MLAYRLCFEVPGWPREAQSNKTPVALVIGDKLLVSTRTGDPLSIVVTAIENDALVGYTEDNSQSQRIEFDDITQIQRQSNPIAEMFAAFAVLLIPYVVIFALPTLLIIAIL